MNHPAYCIHMHIGSLCIDFNRSGRLIHHFFPSCLFYPATVIYSYLLFMVEACAEIIPHQNACYCPAIQGDDVNGKRIGTGSSSKRQIEKIN